MSPITGRDSHLVSSVPEPWEDGRRRAPGADGAELWHFEGRLDNDMTIAIAFCLLGVDPDDPSRCMTSVNVTVTRPGADPYLAVMPGTVDIATVGTAQCDLRLGPDRVRGDLRSYTLQLETPDATFDLRYDAVTDSYRPSGDGHVRLTGDRQASFDVLVTPRCSIRGRIVLAGVPYDVVSEGYHDHQWFDSNPQTTWQHWILGHLYTETHTVVFLELTASEGFGFERTVSVTIFDASGHLITDADDERVVTARTLSVERSSQKGYPRSTRYDVVLDEGHAVIALEPATAIIATDLYAAAGSGDGGNELGSASREDFDAAGIRPSYARFSGRGSLRMRHAGRDVDESGTVRYELSYPAHEDPRAPLDAERVPRRSSRDARGIDPTRGESA